jgi:uncharacterized membrane protein
VLGAPAAEVEALTIVLAVGVTLTSFGIFCGAVGAGAHWPGSDAALLAIIPATLMFAPSPARARSPANRQPRAKACG